MKPPQIRAQLKKLDDQMGKLQDQLDHAEQVEAGDKPSPAQAALIKSQAYSYGVTFIRRKALKKVRQKGELRTSDRRFSSRKEAEHHAKRFQKIHKHKDYSVCVVDKRANAWVNWKTGKTNPAL